MSLKRIISVAAVVSMVTIGVAGCGSSSETKSTDTGTEQPSGEAQANGDDPGDIVADAAGTNAKYGSEATLPDTWPSDLEFPEGLTIVRTSDKSGNKSTVTSTCSGPGTDALDAVIAMFDAGGYTTEQKIKGLNETDGGMATLESTSGDRTVNVTIFGTDGGKCGNVAITYTK